jgi:hypothetical protein
MESELAMDKKTAVYEDKTAEDSASEVANSMIYIEPEIEAAALKKFDKFLVPVSLIFIILSALDRNNVSDVLISRTGQC